MVYKLLFTRQAEKDLKQLDKKITIRILKKLNQLLTERYPLHKAKRLQNFQIETWRFRVGDYRIVFRLDRKTGSLIIMVILRIAHRKDIYKKLQ